jgi:hypothetical protein
MKRDLVVLGIFSNDIDAEMAKGHVESAGIDAIVLKDDVGGMFPTLQETEGVKLMVSRSDAEKAKRILQQRNLI